MNVFSGTWDTIPDSLKDSLVAGKMYVNFHTVNNPAGQIRGQLNVDPSKGHYGVASMTTDSLVAGKVYTVVATGTGSQLQVMKLGQRQVGVAKTAVTSEKNGSTAKSKRKNSF